MHRVRNIASSRWTGVTVALLGMGLMAFGIYRGEMAVVLAKATKICLECIGIG